MSSLVQPHKFVALRLPSGTHKVFKIIPDTTVSLGKYGSFAANSILQKPYYLTYEVLETAKGNEAPPLRVVPASELHADSITEDPSPSESRDAGSPETNDQPGFDLIAEDGQYIVRNNRLTVDDASRQTLTFDEIEELKKAETGSGKDIIAKIMQSHSALDEKTAYSLAKYTLRKTKKFLKRFTVLPLDISMLIRWMINEKEPSRIMELREETLGLMLSWANVRFIDPGPPNQKSQRKGSWLVVDDTSGLLVAAVAERLGILYAEEKAQDEVKTNGGLQDLGSKSDLLDNEDLETSEAHDVSEPPIAATQKKRNSRRHLPDAMSAIDNTITLVHAANEPNISMLSYFGYIPNDTSIESNQHPLYTHLKTLSWIQVLSPELDPTYREPEIVSEDILSSWKSGKRGAYFRKRRRWERTKRVIDETRAGNFNGLVVASTMVPESILLHAVPLLAGGAQVVVYSPTVEPLAELMDSYSSSRKTALISALNEGHEMTDLVPSEDFPVDPRLLLAPSLQTVRAREWQVLPGRTHPVMTARGGAEGFIFAATKVIPATGKVEARGKFTKKRKIEDIGTGSTSKLNGSSIILERHGSSEAS